MNINLGKGGEVEILLVFKDTEKIENANEQYSYLKEKEIFKGNSGEVYSNISHSEDKYVILGLGKEEDLTTESLRVAFFNLGKELMKFKVESIGFKLPKIENLCYSATVQAATEGLLQSEYSFEKYLTEKKTIPTLKDVHIDGVEDTAENLTEVIEETKNLVEGVFLARDLVNEPAMTMTPTILADRAKEELEELGVKVTVLGKKEIEDLGMEAFLAVSLGSAQEPKFIIMEHNGNPDSDKKLALVGKGLTFDSGGYSLKPSNGMETMFADMSGSASVIGTMKAIAKSGLKKNVVAVVAACENLISGGAYKPGDIIGSMSGKTIEVLNTDAEGRLTLADALWYTADVLKADQIVDIATLTGACVVALGDISTGAVTNNDCLMNNVKEASEIAGELIWELPHNDEYKELIKSKKADLKNTGASGATTAGLFLGEFVKDTPWVHLDIAGPAHIAAKRGYLPEGATGIPVKTLYNLAKHFEPTNC